MRTTKRFTPRVLQLYTRQQRGTGTHDQFSAWHQVTRSDPASRGRSHILNYRGRQLHLLSDEERGGVLFSLLCAPSDLREQFPLSLHDEGHESSGQATSEHHLFPGTLSLHQRAGRKHPRVADNGYSAEWVLSTDILLTFGPPGLHQLLAVACKDKTAFTARETMRLAIEHEYWAERQVPWLLITPAQYDMAVRRCLERTWHYHLLAPPCPLPPDLLAELRFFCARGSLTHTLQWLAMAGKLSRDDAQRAFWQSVWRRELLVDLWRGWRPHLPIGLLSPEQFDDLNPIASRRSAWI